MTINEAIEVFCESDENSTGSYEHRRYPACVGYLDGVVAIADEDGENGSRLEMYREVDFIKWIYAAVKAAECGEYESIQEAIGELAPKPSVLDGH